MRAASGGSLCDEFAPQTFTAERTAALVRSAEVVVDTRLRDYIKRRRLTRRTHPFPDLVADLLTPTATPVCEHPNPGTIAARGCSFAGCPAERRPSCVPAGARSGTAKAALRYLREHLTEVVVIVALSVLAVAVRLGELAPTSLFLDDAWVAYVTKAPITDIPMMGLTSPRVHAAAEDMARRCRILRAESAGVSIHRVGDHTRSSG